uniref:Uncharacterized protein LOC111099579 n=1 Tax=Crassostrea virginica TaxID=6565 RepID=A0A8B8A552_CRAVI|nr:uncharacterized protein LOC111099579 [Crassostrea virginica]XP_022286606.1 uncharacterized protein LOC111099579 [Crassostrea virginica]XP_022286607.1 uncharacterized protein LOC111099579 [Crassostrea virginica]
MKSTCTNQVEQLEYHCLPNAWGDKLYEMCATDKEIIGNSCAEYNERGQRIQPNYKRTCNGSDFGVKCPFKYFANQSYLYYFQLITIHTGFFQIPNLHRYFAQDPGCLTISQETTSKSSGKENSTDLYPVTIDGNNLPFFVVYPFATLLIGLVLVAFIYWMWKRQNGKNEGFRVTTEEENM